MRIFVLFSLSISCFFSAAQTVIYSEDFQSGLPVTYSIVDNDGLNPADQVSEFAPAWIALEDPDNAGDTVVGSTSYFDPTGRADRWLITPAITLGAFGNVLYWEGKSHDASFPDGYHVYVSTTDTELESFNDTIFIINSELETWNEHEVSLSAEGYDNVTVHLAFVNRTNDGFKLYLDDIRVETENPLNIEEVQQRKFNVFPNPAHSIIYVEGEFDQLELTDANGSLIFTSSNKELNIEGFHPGIYFLRIIDQGDVQIERVVKY